MQYNTIHIDYFIESALYGFLFTRYKTFENSLVRYTHSFVFQSFATREYKFVQSTFYEVIYMYCIVLHYYMKVETFTDTGMLYSGQFVTQK